MPTDHVSLFKNKNKDEQVDSEVFPECFVIMPISDQEGYESGHFSWVYRDIIPAYEKAGTRLIEWTINL